MSILAASQAPLAACFQDESSIMARLRAWHREGRSLCFVYARSLGGLMQSGRGRISVLNDMALTIDTGGSTMAIMLSGAAFDDTPQIFFTSDLAGHFQVAGINIKLTNHDWLFFSSDDVPQAALPGAGALRQL